MSTLLLGLLLPPPRNIGDGGIGHVRPRFSHGLPEQVNNLGIEASILRLGKALKSTFQVGRKADGNTHFFILHSGIKATAFYSHCTRYETVIKCSHNLRNPETGKGCTNG